MATSPHQESGSFDKEIAAVASTPESGAPQRKKDRTHWLYIMVIVAVSSPAPPSGSSPRRRESLSNPWARRSSHSSR
jgi:hypothetical protein